MMMDTLHLSQRSIFSQTTEVLGTGTAHGLAKLQQINAPKATALNGAVGALNAAEFACAIDGMPCKVAGRPTNSPRQEIAKFMAEIGNASRPEWIANRGNPSVPRYLHPQFLEALMRSIQEEGFSKPQSHTGRRRRWRGEAGMSFIKDKRRTTLAR
jgi:hypothetical protein